MSDLVNVTTLQYLNLEGNNISKDLASLIVSLVCNNDLLKHINLGNCDLPEVERQGIIIQTIAKLCSIEYLKLCGNEIDCVSMKEALSNNNNRIRYLDCSNCKIGAKETYDILISLNFFSRLKSLNLQSGYFNGASALLLSEVIKQNKSL